MAVNEFFLTQNPGSSTTVSAAQASGTVAIPADSQGNTTGVRRRIILTVLGTGGAHFRFVAAGVQTATTNDHLITNVPKGFNVPGGLPNIAHIAANAVTSVLNIATVE